MTRWVVVGGGFRGIMGAHYLSKAGCAVTLVERGSFLGGVMYSREWSGFYLDLGCHLFDNSSDETAETLHEIMDDEVIPIHVIYASVTDGIKQDGVAIPDYTGLDRATRDRILYEVVEASAVECQDSETLAELLRCRFGETLAAKLSSATRKMFGVDPSQLDAAAFASTPFSRVRIVSDEVALVLKQSGPLDERIAASSQDDRLKFYRQQATKYSYRNFYPRGKGTRSFCEKALAHMGRLGVDVVFGESIKTISKSHTGLRLNLSNGNVLETDRVMWAMGSGLLAQILFAENPLDQLVHDVPMAMYYFKCPREQIGEYTYIHDFSEETSIFRASSPGVYGQQFDDAGNTFVCFEVPTKIGSTRWGDAESYMNSIWQEAVHLGMVYGEQPDGHTIIKLPVTYRVAKKGFTPALADINARIDDFSSRISISEQSAFNKTGILESLKDLPES